MLKSLMPSHNDALVLITLIQATSQMAALSLAPLRLSSATTVRASAMFRQTAPSCA